MRTARREPGSFWENVGCRSMFQWERSADRGAGVRPVRRLRPVRHFALA
jgi:hypothetical protein